ncbi:hypothetical protein NEOLEDRAFT_907255 [Neolentinus lepideus HHB14362 ss-1]|uniref:Uncharacterized protein n=1 Tax=Neolentinus lepideus HHB14362 ss-1 TaxID=1314782 RepID=A0A165UJ91_9AGAM|nr:hypothetical protein NEOLEDRAFT_907255 [Neolentinus lepideus HHB14362 ss-1]
MISALSWSMVDSARWYCPASSLTFADSTPSPIFRRSSKLDHTKNFLNTEDLEPPQYKYTSKMFLPLITLASLFLTLLGQAATVVAQSCAV